MCVLFKAALNLSAPVICLTFYNSRLEVANDVFNSVGTSGPVILPRCTRSAAWRHAVGSPGTIAACLHILQALTALPTRTSCRPMMALTSGALETCVRALGTYEPSCTGRPARLFLMFGACGQQGTVGRVVAQSLPHKEAESGVGGHAVHQSPHSVSGAMVHVAASKPFLSWRQDPEPLDT
jgi:hypothetical protein